MSWKPYHDFGTGLKWLFYRTNVTFLGDRADQIPTIQVWVEACTCIENPYIIYQSFLSGQIPLLPDDSYMLMIRAVPCYLSTFLAPSFKGFYQNTDTYWWPSKSLTHMSISSLTCLPFSPIEITWGDSYLGIIKLMHGNVNNYLV